MKLNPDFAAAPDHEPPLSAIERCRQQVQDPALGDGERVRLLCRLGLLLTEAGEFEEAIAHYAQVLRMNSNEPTAHHYQGLTLEHLEQYSEAIAAYDRAIQLQPSHVARIWIDRGNLLRTLGRYAEALKSYEQALLTQPDDPAALSGQGAMLAMLGREKVALQSCDRAMAAAPEAAEVWHSRGVVLLRSRRYQEALRHFEKAIELQPDCARAWANRGMALMQLGKNQDALLSLEKSLKMQPQVEPWQATVWACHAHLLIKAARFEQAIASCEKALAIQPHAHPAAFYKIVSLIMTGKIFAHLGQSSSRKALLRDLIATLGFLKYRLLFVAALLWALQDGNGLEAIKPMLPTVLSLGVVALMVKDLWGNKSRLDFVRQIYFSNGILAYGRAMAIVLLTVATYGVAYMHAPPWLRWGWSNLVFGKPGNIMFQPFHLLDSSLNLSPHLLLSAIAQATYLVGAIVPQFFFSSLVGIAVDWHGFGFTAILIVMFWLLLILGIPFWARFEEKMFRQGANTWKQISVRSTQFGLVHLLAGIPLLGGLVLILPGFLFACRYKHVYDRQLRQTRDPLHAETAGVMASTADHAIYNAILVTIVAASLLLLQFAG
jgi:tetratricopeptide (TPR) repeat protein